ncbi:unannotated protein [freshwater metagenome]|uniref:Unannotated protein n=1 Tax=freshwater metagenome TaxID=449393 RepID=A0A6J7JYU2_9ZZZZ
MRPPRKHSATARTIVLALIAAMLLLALGALVLVLLNPPP